MMPECWDKESLFLNTQSVTLTKQENRLWSSGLCLFCIILSVTQPIKSYCHSDYSRLFPIVMLEH